MNSRLKENKIIAITVLDLVKRTIGWSPKLKKTIYIDKSTEPETIPELKRIREAHVVIAYDQLRDKTIFIELNEHDREHFNEIYSSYLDKGGQILYMRCKEGRRMRAVFTLDQ